MSRGQVHTEPNPEKSSLCPCGKICPSLRDITSRKAGLGGPINCVRNPLITGLPCILSPGKGEYIPDLCAESSESDLMDMCACIETQKEQPPIDGESGVKARVHSSLITREMCIFSYPAKCRVAIY